MPTIIAATCERCGLQWIPERSASTCWAIDGGFAPEPGEHEWVRVIPPAAPLRVELGEEDAHDLPMIGMGYDDDLANIGGLTEDELWESHEDDE